MSLSRRTTALVAVATIVAAALVLLVFPGAVAYISGMPECGPLKPPDALPAPGRDTPMALLAERDIVELKVPEAIRLDRFLDLNRLRRQRAQIRTQLAVPNATGDDQFVIPAGTILKIRLTPEAPDLTPTTPPGTK